MSSQENDHKSIRSKSPNPLQDDDLSELTKKEILFWSRKLKLSPSELFTLSSEHLEKQLEAMQQAEKDADLRKARQERWAKIYEMRRVLMEENKYNRLKGGQVTPRRTIWDILLEAAGEIESIYRSTTMASSGTNGSKGYSQSCATAQSDSMYIPDYNIPAACSTIHEMHPDDLNFTPPSFPSDSSAVSPICPPGNRTFDVPLANKTFVAHLPSETYNVTASNRTYDVPPSADATYNVSGVANRTYIDLPSDAAFSVPSDHTFATNRTYDICPPANDTFNVSEPGHRTYDVGPPLSSTFNVSGSEHRTRTFDVGPPLSSTFNVSGSAHRTRTFDVGPPLSSTFNMSDSAHRNFDVSPPLSPTFNVTGSAHRTFDVRPPASATFTSRPAADRTFTACPPSDRTFSGAARVGCDNSFTPPPMNCSKPDRSPHARGPTYFRNYTDYWMSYSGVQITENSQSITFQDYESAPSTVHAASRTFTVPQRTKSCPPTGRTQGPDEMKAADFPSKPSPSKMSQFTKKRSPEQFCPPTESPNFQTDPSKMPQWARRQPQQKRTRHRTSSQSFNVYPPASPFPVDQSNMPQWARGPPRGTVQAFEQASPGTPYTVDRTRMPVWVQAGESGCTFVPAHVANQQTPFHRRSASVPRRRLFE